MLDFIHYPLLVAIMFFIIFVIIALVDTIQGKKKLADFFINEGLLILLFTFVTFIYYSNSKLFQTVCTNLSVLWIYAFLIVSIVLPILKYFFYKDLFIFVLIFTLIYLIVVIFLYFINIEYDDKRNKEEKIYYITEKYTKDYKCKKINIGWRICHTRYIKFCAKENQNCRTWKVDAEKYNQFHINKPIKVTLYSGYLNTCWLDIHSLEDNK